MYLFKILLKIKKLDKVYTHEVDKTEFLDTIMAFSEYRIRHKPQEVFMRLFVYSFNPI